MRLRGTRRVCARMLMYACGGGRGRGRRISAFPALGGGGNSESPGEGETRVGGQGRDRGSTIRRLLFLRRGRDRRGDRSRLEVSALARSSAALPPPMFFFFAPLRPGELSPSRFDVLSRPVSFSSIIPPPPPPLALTLLRLRFTWRLQCSRVSSISVKSSTMSNKDEKRSHERCYRQVA